MLTQRDGQNPPEGNQKLHKETGHPEAVGFLFVQSCGVDPHSLLAALHIGEPAISDPLPLGGNSLIYGNPY